MKKIGFLIYDINDFAGGEKITIETANKLVDNYEVYLISVIPLKKTKYIIHPNIKILSLNLNNTRVILNYFFGFKPLSRLLKEKEISTLFLIGTNVSLFSLLKYVIKKVKMIYSDHACLKGTLNDKKSTFIRKYSHKICDLTVVLTERNLNHYIEYLGAKKEKLIYIYNPLTVPKAQKNYNSKSNKIITVGRISEEKGFDLLVEVAKELITLNTNWEWDIYGEGVMFEQINQLILHNHLEKHVHLMGATNQIMDLYPNYGIYVLTSYREGLPLVLLEAKACKLPIVSFDIDTGPSEIVRDGTNGYLVEAYNIHKMALVINSLLLDEQKRIEFSDNAYLDIEKFDPNSILDQWKNIIDKY